MDLNFPSTMPETELIENTFALVTEFLNSEKRILPSSCLSLRLFVHMENWAHIKRNFIKSDKNREFFT
jgi:hypothetical protein